MKTKRDKLYDSPMDLVEDFKFNESVVSVFDDMLVRSIPGYAFMVRMIGYFAAQYTQDNSVCYDLGCSLGAVASVMSINIKQKNVSIVAVDDSPAMIEKCKENAISSVEDIEVEYICSDVCDIEIKNASVVAMSFLLQFIPYDKKMNLLEKVYNGLKPGGILLLSDKMVFEDMSENRFQVDSYHGFKSTQGYSGLEIQQKQKALENVLKLDNLNEHRSRLLRIGFSEVNVWCQFFNFSAIIAIKK